MKQDDSMGRESESEVGSQIPTARRKVGIRLRAIERRLGGRERAAAAAGVGVSTLASWVAGSADPKFSKVAALARAAGVSLDWLAYGEGGEARSQPPHAANDLNEQLLLDIIAVAEEVWSLAGLSPQPEEKAAKILAVYKEIVAAQQNGETVSPSRILRLVHSA